MFLMGWVVLAITSKMYSTCWLVSLSNRSRMALVVCGCLPTYWVCRGQQYISTMLSSSSCSISGAYRLARMSISSFSRNSARTRVAIWSKSSVSAVCPDRLVLCLLVFCLLVFCCVAFSKLGSAKFGKSKNGEEQGFTPLFWLLDVEGGGVLLSSPGTA